MRSYAESVGIEYDDLANYNKWLGKRTFIIELGWYDDEYVELLKYIMTALKDSKFIYYRIVDDNPTSYTEHHLIIKKLIDNSNNIANHIIAPYDCKYFGKYYAYVIPYHYDDHLEYLLEEDRKDKAILTGFDCELYPLRHDLYKSQLANVDILKHPGYSGNGWKSGKLGQSFIEHLSWYKVMVVTTGDENELLKYVEAAEAGCAPLGDFPRSLLNLMSSELKYLHCTTVSEFKSKLPIVIKDWKYFAREYRNLIKLHRSLNHIKLRYVTL